MQHALTALAALALLHWLGRLVDRHRRRRSRFHATPDRPPPPDDPPDVSVLIPARDEAHTIEACLAAVLAQRVPPREVIVLDDRSSDGTAAIVDRVAAADPRVRRVAGAPLPDGWKGKPHAVEQASAAASCPWLLMIDADVELDPAALGSALGAAAALDADLLSWFGELRTERLWERLLQPCIHDFILTHSDPARVADPVRPDAIANGQFILVRADVLRALGGMAAVRESIVEDMALARLAKARGHRVRLLEAEGLMRARMYRSFGEIWAGWTKNFYAGLHGRPAVVALALLYLALTGVGPALAVALAGAGVAFGGWSVVPLAVAGASLLAQWAYRGAIAGRYRPVSVLSVFAHPLAATVLAAIIAESARRAATGRPVTWKGRAYEAGGASAGRSPGDDGDHSGGTVV